LGDELRVGPAGYLAWEDLDELGDVLFFFIRSLELNLERSLVLLSDIEGGLGLRHGDVLAYIPVLVLHGYYLVHRWLSIRKPLLIRSHLRLHFYGVGHGNHTSSSGLVGRGVGEVKLLLVSFSVLLVDCLSILVEVKIVDCNSAHLVLEVFFVSGSISHLSEH
jgi:hypothetical protein